MRNSRSTLCWTQVCGVAVQFNSISDVSNALGVNLMSMFNALYAAERKGKVKKFTFKGRTIYIGKAPSDSDIDQQYEKPVNPPLLGFGHCTHRLGVYRGGDW